MAILNQKRILNLIPKVSAPVTIHVSQGDVGTEIQFTLVKGDELFVNPGNVSASVHGIREDGANFGAFTCTLSGSTVSFPLHSEMTAVKGSAFAEIVIVDNDGNKVGSANFAILVEESVFPLGVTYDNDVSVYESILAYVQTIPAQVEADFNTAIAQEANTRSSQIAALENGLNAEASTRESADETEKVERQNADEVLGARIDNLIVPSGGAPSAAEVIDARVGANGVIYADLGDAIRTQVSNINDNIELESEGYFFYRKFSKTDTYRDGYYDTSGVFRESAVWKTSSVKTPISGKMKHIYFGQLMGTSAGMAIFDENDNFIQLITAPTSEAVNVEEVRFITNGKASYCYYCWRYDDTHDIDRLELYSENEYIFENSQNIISLDELVDDNQEGYTKKYNYADGTFDEGYYDSTGTFHSSNAWKSCTTLSEISGNTWYRYFGNLLGTTAGLVIYDVNNNVVQFITSNDETNQKKQLDFYTVPTSKYIRYAYYSFLQSLDLPKYVCEYTRVGNAIFDTNNEYDVIVVGSGIGGISSCYALKDSGLRVALFDKDCDIGGTHIRAFVNVLAEGLPPRWMDDIIKSMLKKGTAQYVDGDYNRYENQDLYSYFDSWTRADFRTDGSYKYANVMFSTDDLLAQYKSDLIGKIDIFTHQEYQGCIVNSGIIESVTFNNHKYFAKVIIDCTGDNIIAKSAGATIIFGEDSQSTFSEVDAPSNATTFTNAPTLFYSLTEGIEDLSDLPSQTFGQFNQIYNNIFNGKLVNNSASMGITGYNVIEHGEKHIYDWLLENEIKQWKLTKTLNSPTYDDYKYNQSAPKLGIRETYRTMCERMLTENDMSEKIKFSMLTEENPLDCLIGVGCHGADIHGAGGSADMEHVNEILVPYRVKFGSIIPLGLKNVFVASRGAGFSHIGASSYRLIKDIGNLGYFAGFAAKNYVDRNLSDVRNVNVSTIQGRNYTDLSNRILQLLSMIE